MSAAGSADPLFPEDERNTDSRKKSKKKRSNRKRRVHPEANGDIQLTDEGLEMRASPGQGGGEGDGRGRKTPKGPKGLLQKKLKSAADVFRVGKKVKEGADKFKELKTSKWKPAASTNHRGNVGVLGIEREPIPDPYTPNPYNEELISYFAQLALDTREDANVDLELVDSLIKRGANVNCTDKHGQTTLHEACRAWETDVAGFLIERGADVNKADLHGRSALHVASAVDYPEMITLLLNHGADIEEVTKGEKQTPMHFAARNDACNALKVLHKAQANIHCRDYKGRSPLQLAAELDRSETAKFLLELGADASDKDNAGQPALVLMITKMPAVAYEALNQLHRMDRANRKQYYDLHHLEPAKADEVSDCRTALQVVVQYNKLDLIMHPAMQRLIDVKWEQFGKRAALGQVVFALMFILMWTVIALTLEEPVVYDFPADIWRMVLGAFAVLLTLWQIVQELLEFFNSKKEFERWKKWRIKEIKKDFQYCHPRWPQESSFLQGEIEEIKSQSPDYFSDLWNYFDWIIYFILMTIFIMHTIDIFIDASGLSAITKRIFAVAVIFIWLRFMKTARAFRALGPFIVMLGSIAIDLARFAFLYIEFYIPYACAFWMIFGNTTVQGMETVDQLLFTLFRMTLVDEYDYDGMRSVDSVMAYILVTSFLAFSAILCLNLLIAVLSETFQRVYDNAKSNAAMQQAAIILAIEDGLSKKRLRRFRNFIHTTCAPDSMFYDDDQTTGDGDELQKVTFQIKDALEELSEQLEKDTALQDASNAAAVMHEEICELHTKQDRQTKQMKKMGQDVKELKQMIEILISAHNTAASSRPSSSPRSNQVSPSRQPDHRHDDTSDSSSADEDDEPRYPSLPKFGQKRTSTPTSARHKAHGIEIRSPVQPSLGLDSILSQSFTLGPHKIPSVLLPKAEEPLVDEQERIQQLRKAKHKQHKQRREKEELFHNERSGEVVSPAGSGTAQPDTAQPSTTQPGTAQPKHSVSSISVTVSPTKPSAGGDDDTTNC